MLQVTGHGKDVFNMSYQSAITEFINREKQSIKRWEMKYKPMYEKRWGEHKKRYLNKKQAVGNTIGRIGSTSEPTVRCVGWGITKLDKRTADKEIARGGLSHYTDGEDYYSKPSEYKRSVHGRTKALGTAFYDTNGIYSFGGDVISKQGAEIDKCHEREMLRIENLRRRMGMYDSQINEETEETTDAKKEGGEEEPIEPCLSDVSEPIEDSNDSDSLDMETEKEEPKKKSKVPVVVPELEMEKVREHSRGGSREKKNTGRKTTGRKSTGRISSRRISARSQTGEQKEEQEEEPVVVVEKKKESVFQRARRGRKGKKKQKISAYNSYGNPLYPRFSSHTPRSTTAASSTCSSARRKRGKTTPRHEELMKRLESMMEKKHIHGKNF